MNITHSSKELWSYVVIAKTLTRFIADRKLCQHPIAVWIYYILIRLTNKLDSITTLLYYYWNVLLGNKKNLSKHDFRAWET